MKIEYNHGTYMADLKNVTLPELMEIRIGLTKQRDMYLNKLLAGSDSSCLNELYNLCCRMIARIDEVIG